MATIINTPTNQAKEISTVNPVPLSETMPVANAVIKTNQPDSSTPLIKGTPSGKIVLLRTGTPTMYHVPSCWDTYYRAERPRLKVTETERQVAARQAQSFRNPTYQEPKYKKSVPEGGWLLFYHDHQQIFEDQMQQELEASGSKKYIDDNLVSDKCLKEYKRLKETGTLDDKYM